ncbi:MAG: hypothetical protein KJ626_06325 [Verrucomicrobia bacterium]|nr:hypothetical protein [Verrucomicrobiota bacterium]
MKIASHRYEVEVADVMKTCGWTLLPLLLFAAFMHAGNGLNALPSPLPILDMDRTILVHQASVTPDGADVLLVGDSSCLIDVNARELEQRLQEDMSVLNLGTLSHLSFDDFMLISERHFSRGATPNTVVLLLHPEFLRRPRGEACFSDVLLSFLAGREQRASPGARNAVSRFLGVSAFRERILSRVLPSVVSPSYRRRYGFTRDLLNGMTQARGSVMADGVLSAPQKDARTYSLNEQRIEDMKHFAGRLPEGVRLIIGITPLPDSLAPEEYPLTFGQMLKTLGSAGSADTLLLDLPPTMPDMYFADRSHLNVRGAVIYTQKLAESLGEEK